MRWPATPTPRSSRARSKVRSIAAPTAISIGRAKQVANALTALGVQRGDRVATLAWNGYRHMELYFGVSGMGAVLHTVNPRLFPEQLEYIINHAEDTVLFFDLSFVALVEKLAPRLKTVRALRGDDRPRAHARVRHPRPAVLRGPARGRNPTTMPGPTSTRTPPPRCATPRAPRACPRACCIRTARPCCTPSAPAPWTASACRGTKPRCWWCRCSMSTPGACPTPAP